MERERDIEKRLRCQIERMGGKFMKFVSPGNDGVPDLVCRTKDAQGAAVSASGMARAAA